MKKRIYIFLYCITLFIGLLTMQSCNFDGYLDCSSQSQDDSIRIYFNYLPKDLTLKGINATDVKSISLFIFDQNKKFVLSKIEENITLNKDYYIGLKLKTGVYTFVAWGNLNDPYSVTPSQFESGITDINTAILYLKRPQSNSITTAIPSLFFADKTAAEITTEKQQQFHLPLVQNTNNIKLIVKGLPHNKDEYSFTINDNNSKYKFDNSFAPDTEFYYKTITSLNTNYEIHTSLTVLRLAEDRHAMMDLYNQTKSKLTYKHDLIDLLKRLEDQHANIDWTNTHDFEIVLTFGADLEIQVTINGWNVVTDDVQLP